MGVGDAAKARVKHAIPPRLLNALLLRFPRLYATRLVAYESNLVGALPELLEQLNEVSSIPGDIIECGSSRAGTSVVMALRLRQAGVRKRILACDSFQGFDRRELEKERAVGLTTVSDGAFRSTSYQYVTKKLEVLRMTDTVIPVPGFFQESLEKLPGPFSLGLIDCDLRESMLFAANHVWGKLASGGRLLLDDYLAEDFKGARLAATEFVVRHRDEIADHGLLRQLYLVVKA